MSHPRRFELDPLTMAELLPSAIGSPSNLLTIEAICSDHECQQYPRAPNQASCCSRTQTEMIAGEQESVVVKECQVTGRVSRRGNRPQPCVEFGQAGRGQVNSASGWADNSARPITRRLPKCLAYPDIGPRRLRASERSTRSLPTLQIAARAAAGILANR